MSKEVIKVSAGGQEFKRWTKASVDAGGEQATRGFTLETTEPDVIASAEFIFAPGTEVTITVEGQMVCKGYVDDYTAQFTDTSHSATITGRSKSKDHIDSSAIHEHGHFKDKTMLDIARELDKFGVGFHTNIQLDKVTHQLVPGATVFSELEMLARHQGVLLIGEADGSVMITRAGKSGRHQTPLIEGTNILSGSGGLSEKERHSHHHVRGQRTKGKGAKALRLEHIAKDEGITRYRPHLIVAEGDLDQGQIKKRAEWNAKRSAGWEVAATVVVLGWRDRDGHVWDPKKLVYLESPKLKIAQDMAIKKVVFTQDGAASSGTSSGTTTSLTLCDPQSLGGDSVKGKSNKHWKSKVS